MSSKIKSLIPIYMVVYEDDTRAVIHADDLDRLLEYQSIAESSGDLRDWVASRPKDEDENASKE